MKKSDNTRRSGFTLIEVTVGATLMISMIAAVAMAAVTANNAYEDGVMRDEMNSRAHGALEFMVGEVSISVGDRIDPVPDPIFGLTDFTYFHPTGYSGGALQLGPQREFTLELEQGELDDGIDNNSNGVVDEQVLVWRQNPGDPDELEVVKTRFVRELLAGELPNGLDDNGNGLIDEPGMVMSLDGDVMTIRLTVERQGPNGLLFAKTVETAVRVEN